MLTELEVGTYFRFRYSRAATGWSYGQVERGRTAYRRIGPEDIPKGSLVHSCVWKRMDKEAMSLFAGKLRQSGAILAERAGSSKDVVLVSRGVMKGDPVEPMTLKPKDIIAKARNARRRVDGMICRCGHRHDGHMPILSPNYTAGRCRRCRPPKLCVGFVIATEGCPHGNPPGTARDCACHEKDGR